MHFNWSVLLCSSVWSTSEPRKQDFLFFISQAVSLANTVNMNHSAPARTVTSIKYPISHVQHAKPKQQTNKCQFQCQIPNIFSRSITVHLKEFKGNFHLGYPLWSALRKVLGMTVLFSQKSTHDYIHNSLRSPLRKMAVSNRNYERFSLLLCLFKLKMKCQWNFSEIIRWKHIYLLNNLT
jgi:hypothetical protein